MSEINKNKKVAITFRCGTSGAPKWYPIDNTMISGKTGSGVHTLLNNILVEMIVRHSPNELSLEIYEHEDRQSVWTRCERKPWCMRSQPNKVKSVCERICQIKEYLQSGGRYGDYHKRDCDHVIVLCDVDYMFDTYPTEFCEAINYIAEHGREFGFYLICVAGYVKTVENLLPYFRYRVGTRLDEDVSNMFMGCNICYNEKTTHGFAWVWDSFYPVTYNKYIVRFYPDTFISKLLKVYSKKDGYERDDYEIFSEERLGVKDK